MSKEDLEYSKRTIALDLVIGIGSVGIGGVGVGLAVVGLVTGSVELGAIGGEMVVVGGVGTVTSVSEIHEEVERIAEYRQQQQAIL